MTNHSKPKPDFDAGVKALATPTTNAEQVTDSSDYGKTPTPGNVTAPCKTEGCSSAIDFGFVYDTVTWIEKFKPTELTCPTCNLKALYSSSDLVLHLAER